MPANQKRNDIKDTSKKKMDELKWKLEEAEDAPNIPDMVSVLPPPKIIEKQDRSGQPKGERVNIVFEVTFRQIT